jgi:hypothetical protein
MDPYSDPIGGVGEGGGSKSSRHATDWGLSSLLMALALMMMFPISLLVLAIGFPLVAVMVMPGNVPYVYTVADVAVYSFVGLSVLSVLFGMVGLISGFVRNQPVGLPTSGLLVGIVALILWVMMYLVVGELKRALPSWQQQHHQPQMFPDGRFR